MNLSSLTCLITGSTDGIGRHTALKLAQKQATILLHGRNEKKVNETVQEIKKITKSKNVFPYVYDLSSLNQVKAFADQVIKDHPKIDILINNAGVFELKKKISEDGFELTWAVNVLAPYVLTCLLIKNIDKKIINVASISTAHHIDFDNLQQEKGYDVHDAYSLSKLGNIIITLYLARQIKKHKLNITVNCLDPGTVNTKMLNAGWGNIGINIDKADNEFFLATNPSVDDKCGYYYVNNSIRNPPKIAQDIDIQEKFIKILENQSKLKLELN